MPMSNLTERQQEVLQRLEKSMGAQAIADELGITRNAVYQQIQAIRKKGYLDPGFTPSGQAPRAIDAPPQLRAGESALEYLVTRQLEIADMLERLATQLRAEVGAAR